MHAALCVPAPHWVGGGRSVCQVWFVWQWVGVDLWSVVASCRHGAEGTALCSVPPAASSEWAAGGARLFHDHTLPRQSNAGRGVGRSVVRVHSSNANPTSVTPRFFLFGLFVVCGAWCGVVCGGGCGCGAVRCGGFGRSVGRLCLAGLAAQHTDLEAGNLCNPQPCRCVSLGRGPE